jgi:thiol-activated cytolysin
VRDATYRRDNPGRPVAYTVAFLKDHEFAKMGFTTEYTETVCKRYPNGFVRLEHRGAYVARFRVGWEVPEAPVGQREQSWESGDKTAGYTQQIDLPGDARAVHIQAWVDTWVAWDRWQEALNVWEDGPSNKIYTIGGSTLDRTVSVREA